MFSPFHALNRSRLASRRLLSLCLVAALFTLLQVHVATAATLTVCDDGGSCYATIQEAIDAAASGDVITIEAGTYTENLVINGKYVTLQGAGNGTGAGDNTIIQGSINVQSGGASATLRQVIENLRVAGAGQRGIELMGSHITLSNVTVTAKKVGVYIHEVEDLIVEDSNFIDNEYGFRVENRTSSPVHTGKLNNAVIRGSYFTGGFIALIAEQVTTETGQFDNVQIVDTRFEEIQRKAIYLEMGNNVLLNRVEIDRAGIVGNDEVPTNAIDINLKFQAYDNIEIRDSVITNSGAEGLLDAFPVPSAIDIKARDDGGTYGANPASATNIRLIRVTVADNPFIGIRFGESGKDNGGPTSPVILHSQITNNGGHGLVNDSRAAVIAENNWWGCETGPNTAGCDTTLLVNANGSIDTDPWLTAPYSPPPPSSGDSDSGGRSQPPEDVPVQPSTFPEGSIGQQTSGAITASGNNSAMLTPLVVNGDGNFAAVGDPNLISMGIVQAVDVFTFLPGGVMATTFEPPITVCLLGAGTVYFRPAADQTGTFVPAPAFPSGSYLCVTLYEPGLLVLVGTVTGTPAVQNVPAATTGASTPLTDCQVTTEYILRLRADANTSSPILDRLPMGTTVNASETRDGWFKVVFGDQEGWVSGDFVSTSANCG